MARLALLLLFCCRLHALNIVVLGDSVAHGAGDESGLGGIAGRIGAMNAAINGSRTWQVDVVIARAAVRSALEKADAIVVSIGGNDLFGDRRAQWLSMLAPRLMMDVTLDRMERIVARLHRVNARARVVLVGLYNPYGPAFGKYVALWDSKLLARFADDRRVTVVRIADLFTDHRERISPLDHFHPGAEGYALIARRIQEGLPRG